MKKTMLILVITLALVLTACGGSDGGGSASAEAGKELFAQTVIGNQPGCATCHSLKADVVVVGPSLAGIATRAATTVSGQSAEDYIKESITTPDAFLVGGFPAGTMPQVWSNELSAEQIDQLVAYLMTLK